MIKKCLLFILCLLFPCVGYAGSITTSGDLASNVITRVRYIINETTADFWTDAELVVYINEAVKETVNRTRCLESGVSNIIVKKDTDSYAIPDTISGVSFGGVSKVEYDIGLSGNTTDQSQIYELDRTPWENIRLGYEKEVKGTPKTFSVWNNTLYIFPIPRDDPASGVTMSGNTIYFYNLKSPSGVTATTSSIDTPSYLDAAIDIYTAAKAMLKWHGSYDRFEKDLLPWEKRCDRYRIDIMKREIPEKTQ